eukprot:1354250-Amphidinium_carterae.2
MKPRCSFRQTSAGSLRVVSRSLQGLPLKGCSLLRQMGHLNDFALRTSGATLSFWTAGGTLPNWPSHSKWHGSFHMTLKPRAALLLCCYPALRR